MVDYDELFVANPADQREWQLPRTPIRDNEPRWLTKMRHQQTRSRHALMVVGIERGIRIAAERYGHLAGQTFSDAFNAACEAKAYRGYAQDDDAA